MKVGAARDCRYDVMKGVAIILMVMGHTTLTQGLHDFIYLFHMPVFFIVAGWFLSVPRDAASLRDSLWKKVLRVWLPYVFWAGLWIVLHDALIACNVYSVDHFQDTTWARQGMLQTWGMAETFRRLAYVPLMTGGATGLGAPYWFLATFFFATAGYSVLDYLINRYKLPRMTLLTVIALASVVLARYADWKIIAYISDRVGGRQLFTAVYLVYLGVLLRHFKADVVRLPRWGRMVVGGVAFILLITLEPFGTLELVENQFPSVIFLTFSALAGWFVLATIVDFCGEKVSVALSYIGRRSLTILTLHLPCFWLVSAVGVIILGLPKWTMAKPITAFSGPLWTIAYVVVGVGVPLALRYIYDRLQNQFRK